MVATGAVDVKKFLWRRGSKIYPPLWILVIFTLSLNWFRLNPSSPGLLVRGALAEILFVQNYFPGLWTHTWSLAVEEHFYLAIALAAAIGIRKPAWASVVWRRRIEIVSLLVAAIVLLRLRTSIRLLSAHSPDTHALFATPLNADGLIIGCFIALSLTFGHAHLVRTIQARRFASVAAAGLLLAPLFIWDYADDRYLVGAWAVGKVIAWIAAFLLVCVALTISSFSHPILRWLAGVGRASYSIYLWHQVVNHLGARSVMLALGTSNWWVYAGVYLGGSICLGLLMHELVERPVLALRDRIFPAGGTAK